MKKRIMSVVLVLALALSLGSVISFAAGTGSQTGLSADELAAQLQQFIDTGKTLAARDDWQNIEGAEKAASTVVLETQIADAEETLERGDADAMEACLIGLFGEWNADENAFAEPEKPYDDFKTPLFLSASALDAEAARGEKGYNTKLFYAVNDREHSFENLGRYSEDSWAEFVAAVKAIDALTLVDTDSMEKPEIDSATRSQVAALLDTYYAAYDGLVGARRTAIYEQAKAFQQKCLDDIKFAALYDGIAAVDTAVTLYEGVVAEIEEYSANWNMDAPDYDAFSKLVAKQEQAAFGIQTALGNLKLIANTDATTVEEVMAVGRNVLAISRAYLQDQIAAAAKLGYSINELYMTGFADYQASVKDLEMFLDSVDKQLQGESALTDEEKNKLLTSVMSSIVKHQDLLSEFQMGFDSDLLYELLYPEEFEEEFEEE